jgi:hypothetical protein
MGIGIVLIFWLLAGTALAVIAAVLLRAAADRLTRGAHQDRQKLFKKLTFFPFACLVWAGAVFISQSLINETVFYRDAGMGDSWQCPLPSGYAILMVDLADEGVVYNPKTQPGGGAGAQEDAVDGVRILQISDRYVLGGFDSQWFEHRQNDKGAVDSYFVLDTQLGKKANFPSYDALHARAQELGVTLDLEPIISIYWRYRFGWFDVLAALLLFLPPLVGFIFLVRWTLRVRKTRVEPLPT